MDKFRLCPRTELVCINLKSDIIYYIYDGGISYAISK